MITNERVQRARQFRQVARVMGPWIVVATLGGAVAMGDPSRERNSDPDSSQFVQEQIRLVSTSETRRAKFQLMLLDINNANFSLSIKNENAADRTALLNDRNSVLPQPSVFTLEAI